MSGSTNSVPAKWRLTTIGAVCSKPQYGWTTSAADSGEVKLLRTTDITRGPVDWSTVPFCLDVPPDVEKYLLAEGDIVVSRAGSVGVSCRIVAPERSVFASYLIRFRPKEEIDGKYLTYVLQSPAYWSQVRGNTSGIAVPNVNASKLESFEIPLAPLSEQRRIVAEIEKQFTRLDAGIAALRRTQANLKRYRAAVLKAACEGRLVPTEADLAKQQSSKRGSLPQKCATPDFESGTMLLSRILAERRRSWIGRCSYKEPAVPDTKNLQPLPEGWAWATAEQLTSLVTSGSRGWGEFYSDSGLLFIRAQDIKTDSLRLSGVARVALPEKAEGMRSSVENTDLLITITGANVTKSAIVRGLSEMAFVSQHVALLKPVCREASAFLFLWVISPAHGRKILEQWAYGAGKPGLSLEQIRTLPIALPPLAEQTRIVAEVERRLSVVGELEMIVNANLQRATRIRQSILQRSFTA